MRERKTKRNKIKQKWRPRGKRVRNQETFLLLDSNEDGLGYKIEASESDELTGLLINPLF